MTFYVLVVFLFRFLGICAFSKVHVCSQRLVTSKREKGSGNGGPVED